MENAIAARGLRIDLEVIPDARKEDFEEYLTRQGIDYSEMMHDFVERAKDFCYYALLTDTKKSLQVRPIPDINEKLYFILDPMKPSVIIIGNQTLLDHLMNDPDSTKDVSAEWLIKVTAQVLTSESKEVQEYDHSQFTGIDMSKVN